MKLGIIKERKSPPDRRVVLSPKECRKLLAKYSNLNIEVESSDIRVFSDNEYLNEGIKVVSDVSNCDVLLGVKEVPIENLIPNKKYFFFSHTIKKQPYNQKLLLAVLSKNIELFDHEVITNKENIRLISFGRYAGIVGAYNAFRTYGLKYNSFNLPKVENLKNQKEVILELKNIKLPNIKIVLTGKGRVGNGAKEMFDKMGLKEVTVNEYLTSNFNESVYVQIDVLDYNKRKDGLVKNESDFFNNANEYISDFARFAKVSDLYIASHFYDNKAPFIFTREDAKSKDFKINVIADISCDIDGPVASTIRASTIENPIYGYNPHLEKEVNYLNLDAIAVMAVDNLPCELPKDASEWFGESFSNYVAPAFFNNDKDGVLFRARMTKDKKLTDRFSYLQDYIDG